MAKTGRGGRRNQRRNKPTSSSSHPPPPDSSATGITTLLPVLMLEIFCRTPVKSLARFRCVSKSWYALLNHPNFIKMHLTFNISTNNKHLLCKSYNPDLDPSLKLLVLLRGATDPPVHVLHIDKFSANSHNYPTKINFRDFSKAMALAGSINGVVCLSHFGEMRERFVALWNPAINYWNPIALPQTKSWCNVSVGLGFDKDNNDFKIICIVPVTCSSQDFGWSRVEIYSVNRDSWESGGDERGMIPFQPIVIPIVNCRPSKFIVKDVPYWEGVDAQPGDSVSSVEILCRIDPCTGLYKKVMYPQHGKKTEYVVPVNWKDSVAALVKYPCEYQNWMVDMYVLDEITDIWTMIYCIGPLDFVGLRTPQCFCTGEIVVETWSGNCMYASQVVSYFCDLKTSLLYRNNEIEVLYPFWYEAYSHVESLVCVKGMVQIGNEHKDRKTNPKKKNWTELLSKDFETTLHL